MKIALATALTISTLLYVGCAAAPYHSGLASSGNGSSTEYIGQNESERISDNSSGAAGNYTVASSGDVDSEGTSASGAGPLEKENANLRALVTAQERKIKILESRLQRLESGK